MIRKKYEILLALLLNHQEEEIKALLENLEKIINTEGGSVEEVQRLDRKEFAYPHRHKKAAFYVSFKITAEPSSIAKIRQKLTLVEEVTLQNYFQEGEADAPRTPKKTKKRSSLI